MRIPSGKIDQKIFFVALDTTLTTRVTGLSSWTVYRSRNGGTATVYTTPTVAELSASNMPGVYSLLIDEDTTIASTSDSEEYAVHITATGMAPVTRTIELYRQIWEASTANHTTAGTFGQKVNNIYTVVDTEVATLQTDVTAVKAKTDQLTFGTANRVNAQVYGMEANVITAAATATDFATEVNTGIATSAALATLQTSVTTIDDFLDTEMAAVLAAVDTEVAAIKAKTDSLTFTTALRVDCQVYGMQAGTVTAAAIATDAIDNDAIAANAVTEIQSGLATSASIAALPTAAVIAGAVWDEDATAHQTVGTFGRAIGDPATSAGIHGIVTSMSTQTGTMPEDTAFAVWNEALAGHTTAGTAGKAVGSLTFTVANQIDANIESVNATTVTGSGTGGSPWGP